ncbi:MAG: hypothetical protein R3240_13205, partial [Gammaproteobacteria bacterium]|nr:hypothetical protein [Gammaproteobacteria bacterium]
MKNAILLILIFMFYCSAINASERDTIMGEHKYESGGFGGPTLSFTQVNGNSTWSLGGKGAWLVNHSYYLGGGGFNTFLNEADNDGILQHEGLIMGYIGRPSELFHYGVELLVGFGQLILDKQSSADYIYAAEPQVYLGVNLASFVRLNIGASYRYISGSDSSELTDSDLSGASLNLAVMFG